MSLKSSPLCLALEFEWSLQLQMLGWAMLCPAQVFMMCHSQEYFCSRKPCCGTGAVYSWGGGGTGPQGIDFDFPVHIPNKGNTWFSKPARVDRQAEDSHATDPTFFDWHDRWKAPSKEALRELKDKALTLRMQTPHAPDMLELARVFERTLNLDEAPRHFDQWKPRDGLSDDASTVTTVATASR
jgi:hypothetical protein